MCDHIERDSILFDTFMCQVFYVSIFISPFPPFFPSIFHLFYILFYCLHNCLLEMFLGNKSVMISISEACLDTVQDQTKYSSRLYVCCMGLELIKEKNEDGGLE